jgi:hypothetical protein
MRSPVSSRALVECNAIISLGFGQKWVNICRRPRSALPTSLDRASPIKILPSHLSDNPEARKLTKTGGKLMDFGLAKAVPSGVAPASSLACLD